MCVIWKLHLVPLFSSIEKKQSRSRVIKNQERGVAQYIPKNYAHSFAISTFYLGLVPADFIHVCRGYFSGTGKLILLPKCQLQDCGIDINNHGNILEASNVMQVFCNMIYYLSRNISYVYRQWIVIHICTSISVSIYVAYKDNPNLRPGGEPAILHRILHVHIKHDMKCGISS